MIGREFLASGRLATTACLLLDIATPGMSGPDLQRAAAASAGRPDRLHYGHADQSDVPRLIEQGAVACLLKPFGDTALREALDAALASP